MTIPRKTLIGATLASLCMWAGIIQAAMAVFS